MSRPTALDRRAFLGAMGAAAGVAAAAAVAPLSARAMSLPALDGAEPIDHSSFSAASEPSVGADDWDIDDMWGHSPRYAHPIPYSPVRTSPVEWESVDPIDRMLMI
jgi:hypothetical protein